jgi:ribosome-associated protein
MAKSLYHTSMAPTTPDERPSKSERKRMMHALQELGERLVALKPQELAGFELPESLNEAIAEARRITDFEGRRRQLQYVGKLMREADAESIRARLDTIQGAAREHTQLHRAAEQWRDELLQGGAALEQFAARHPQADRARLEALVASVNHDRGRGAPPRQYRELFRVIRGILQNS